MLCSVKKCIFHHTYKTIIGFFLLVIVSISIISAYQSYNHSKYMELSQKYFELSDYMQNNVQANNIDLNQLSIIINKIDHIKINSAYANMAHLLLAKYYFEHKQYDLSISNIKLVLANSVSTNMTSLAYNRLINVYIANHDLEAAKKILLDHNLISNPALAPSLYEAKGDFYLALKDYSKAIAAYQQVIQLSISDETKMSSKIKLQLLGVNH